MARLRRAAGGTLGALGTAPAAAAVAVLFLSAGLAGAVLKEMWFDEIHTFALARLGSLDAIRAALDGGADGNRVGFYAVTLASTRLLGPSPFSIRLLPALGFLAFSCSLGLFAARRWGPRAGWVAAAVPYLTGARFYAFEGRQYGIVLGFTGAALLGWQAACEGRRSGRWLLGAALVGGCIVSPLTAFTLLALAAGEAWRTVARRRIDWGVAASFALAAGAHLLSQRAAAAGFARIAPCGGTNGLPPGAALLESYGWLLGLFPLVYKTGVALAAWTAWQAVAALRDRRSRTARAPEATGGFYPHELVLAASLLLVPFAVVAATRLPGWPCYPRYSIAASGGLALLLASLFSRFRAPGRGRTSAALLVAMALGSLAMTVKGQRPGPEGPGGLAVLASIAAPGEGPVVVASAFYYLKFTFYAPPALRSRMLMLEEPDPAKPGWAKDGVLVCVAGLSPYWPLRVEAYGDFLGAGTPFTLVAGTGNEEWIRARLTADRYRLTPLGRAGPSELYRVEPPDGDRDDPPGKTTYPR